MEVGVADLLSCVVLSPIMQPTQLEAWNNHCAISSLDWLGQLHTQIRLGEMGGAALLRQLKCLTIRSFTEGVLMDLTP